MPKHARKTKVSRPKTLCVRVARKKGFKLICHDPLTGKTYTVPAQNIPALARGTTVWIQSTGRTAILLTSPSTTPVPAVEKKLKRAFAVEEHFPSEIGDCLRDIGAHERQTSGRVDLRDALFFTMDGAKARDFDDAISIQDKGDHWDLMVAIADVTHYVRFAKRQQVVSLDGEAMQRGTSFYFPTSVLPMLPMELSNNLCSLLPEADRLVLVCDLRIAKNGTVEESHFFEAIIRSKARLSYEFFARCFEENDPKARENLRKNPFADAIIAALDAACDFAETARNKRAREGSLLLTSHDVDYMIGPKATLVDLRYRAQTLGHKLVEECMLAANEACARYLLDHDIPFLSRVHPEPDATALRELGATLAFCAPSLLPDHDLTPRDIAQLLIRAKDTDKENVVNHLCLRALPLAYYDPNPIGHFGLAKDAYCHFTSPIRRYADITVHRALKVALGCAVDPCLDNKRLAHVADHINRQEETADALERAMRKKLACLFLADHVGECFQAYVRDIEEKGVFVHLNNLPVSGLIPRASLSGYRLDCAHKRLVQKKGSHHLLLGSTVNVRLLQIDLMRSRLAFTLDASR